MLSDFFSKLTGARNSDKPLPPLDAQLATGALLVRIAKTDAHYAVEEIAAIDNILARRDGLNPVEAAKLRATCERIEAEAPDTEVFIKLVQDNVPHEARVSLCKALVDVSKADHLIKLEETEFLTRVSDAFGLTQADLDADEE